MCGEKRNKVAPLRGAAATTYLLACLYDVRYGGPSKLISGTVFIFFSRKRPKVKVSTHPPSIYVVAGQQWWVVEKDRS